MKLLVRVLFFILIFEQASASILMEGMRLIEKKQYDQAGQVLEKAFNSEDNDELLLRYSLVLAQLPGKSKLNNPRHYYASYAARRVESKDHDLRFRLLRIAADGYFSTGSLKKATDLYQQSMLVPGVKKDDIQYVMYQLGWVHVNNKNKPAAVNRFSQAIDADPDSPLAESIASDLGKIWSETQVEQGGFSLQVLEKHQASKLVKFLGQGIVQGYVRKSSQFKTQYIDSLNSSPLIFNSTMPPFLQSPLVEKSKACSYLSLLDKLDLSQLEVETYLPTVDVCIENVTKQSVAKSKKSLIFSQINRLLGSVRIHGQGQWALIGVFEKLGNSSKLCQASTEMVSRIGEDIQWEKVDSKKKDFGAAISLGLKNCKKSDENVFLTKMNFVSMWKIFSNIKDSVLREGMADLFSLDALSPHVLNMLVHSEENLNSESLFLVLDRQKISWEDYLTLTDKFSANPIEVGFLPHLSSFTIEQRNKFLRERAALTSQLTLLHLLEWWKLFAEGGEIRREDFELIGPLTSNKVKGFAESQSDVKKLRQYQMIVSLREGKFEDILNNWDKFSQPLIKEKDLLASFFSKVLQGPEEWAKTWSQSAPNFGRTCLELHNKLASEDPVGKIVLPPAIQGSPLDKDLKNLARVERNYRSLSRKTKNFSRYVENELPRLKKLIDTEVKREYGVPKVRQKALKNLNQQVAMVEQSLEKLGKSGPLAAQFLQMKELVGKWAVPL